MRIGDTALARMARCCWLIAVCLGLCGGCAGYKLGPTNGQVAGVKSIQVNLFRNDTFEPRLSEAIATALRRTLQQDGTYRLNTQGDGDIIVDGVITRYLRSGVSFQPRDTITPTDFQITIVTKITATERSTGKVLMTRDVAGRTTIRIGPDLASAERQAVPNLAEDLALNVTGLLVDGIW